MPYQTGIPAALRARGVKVETVNGWQRRGSSAFNPRGVTCHWTAGPWNAPASSRPSLNVVTHGRPGLNGPLCNVYLDRRGIAVVVAAGRANHAGSGGYRGLSGNSSVFGIEAESGGDVPRSDWTAAQRREYPKVVAALVDLTPSNDATYVHGHNEWTPRKIDIRDWPMPLMRQQVNAILKKEGFLMALSDKDQKLLFDRVERIATGIQNGKKGSHSDGQVTRIIKNTDRNVGVLLRTLSPGGQVRTMIEESGGIDLDPAAIAEEIAASIPEDLAAQVVDELGKRVSR